MGRKFLTGVFLITGTLLIPAAKALCQDDNPPKEAYVAANIPDSLKNDEANSVLRYSYTEVNINGPGKAVIKHHWIITVLNEKADNMGVIVLPYNRKYDSFSDISIHVYDPNGNQIKKYHKSDMYDGAAISDEVMVTDERFLGLQQVISSYPSTIELSCEEDLSSFISLDDWDIQRPEEAVQTSIYKIIAKPEVGLRYKNDNISISPVKTSAAGMDTYTWKLANLKAIKLEDGAELWTVMPRVLFGTNSFNCYGYAGDMDSWQDFGKWILGLNKDVCTLTPQRVAEIKQMTDTIKSDKAKARFLYEYLQKSMRYVNVSLGIGGYKPFDANFVDQKKYGDCKALANYMYALLNAVNIPAYWAVVRAGQNEYAADPNFPVNQFNHEILCIPFKNDTTWLDCTMTTRAFGKPGPFTENRNALLITQDGGKLVNTPKSIPDDNQFNSIAHIILDTTGGAKVELKIFCTGEYREEYIGMTAMKEDEQKEVFLRDLNIKQPSVFELKYGEDKNYTKEVDLNLEYDRFYDIAVANKQFYHPLVFDLWNLTVPILDKRKSDYYVDFPRVKTCVTTIDLPPGFEVETLPNSQDLKFTYGNYQIKYTYNAIKNQVISTARFNLNNYVIPPSKYTEMQQYFDAIQKAQNKKLVIRRKA